MAKPRPTFAGPYTVEAIDKELAQTTAELQEYNQLLQYASDLQQMRLLILRMSGKLPSTTPAPVTRKAAAGSSATSDFAKKALSHHGPLALKTLVQDMREMGWRGSGDNAVDQKRVYAAMFRMKRVFERTDDGKWKLQG
jgi:hypothetical protein